jgi:hypothetical protein
MRVSTASGSRRVTMTKGFFGRLGMASSHEFAKSRRGCEGGQTLI